MKKPDDKNPQIFSNNQTNLTNCTINNNYNINLGQLIVALLLFIVALLIVSLIAPHVDPKTLSRFIQLLYEIVKD
ncbi:hypothetical protein [Lacrimispora sp.]|uniref:hypothetical protein n=1 Tax=Lacrimispora sp. TaxID=2719234 RepID=UPI0028AAB114|nr:hypothetical protein [Lacrimispora sp.]